VSGAYLRGVQTKHSQDGLLLRLNKDDVDKPGNNHNASTFQFGSTDEDVDEQSDTSFKSAGNGNAPLYLGSVRQAYTLPIEFAENVEDRYQ
jgi:hypothetical protein